MDFAANPDHEAIATAIRELCKSFDDEYWSRCDRDHTFPFEFYEAMAQQGWLGIAIPEEYGGGGAGISEAAILLSEVAASGAAMNGCSALHLTIFGLQPVIRFGSERLKQAFLPRAASGDLHVAFGVTEADAGTDTSRIATRAVRKGDSWIISGRKIWTTKALESEVVLLLVRTEEAGENRFDGLTLFLADLDPDYVAIKPIPKVGRNAVASCEVFYDELPVEAWRMVGDEGKGFQHILAGLNPERVLIAAEAVAIGRAALDKAVEYARERIVFGKPIGSNQAISHPLAEAHARLEAAWQMVLRAAWRHDNGMKVGADANIAKFLAADAGFFACDRAMQTLGGMGYATEYHVERYWREARLMRLAPISQEMTLNYIAHQVLHLPRSY